MTLSAIDSILCSRNIPFTAINSEKQAIPSDPCSPAPLSSTVRPAPPRADILITSGSIYIVVPLPIDLPSELPVNRDIGTITLCKSCKCSIAIRLLNLMISDYDVKNDTIIICQSKRHLTSIPRIVSLIFPNY